MWKLLEEPMICCENTWRETAYNYSVAHGYSVFLFAKKIMQEKHNLKVHENFENS